MMTATYILKLAEENDIFRIIEECKRSIYEDQARIKGGNTLKQRYNSAVKYIKNIDDNRPQLKGARYENYQGNTVQVLVDGCTGVMLYQPIDGLLDVLTVKGDNLSLVGIINDNLSRYQDVEIDLNDIKSFRKINGKYDSGKNKVPYVIDDRHFDADCIISMCDILGGDIKATFSSANPLTAMILESENGKAIVLPLRK